MNCRTGDEVIVASRAHAWFGQIVRVLGAADPELGFVSHGDDPTWVVGWAGAQVAAARDSELQPLRGFYSRRPRSMVVSPAMGAPEVEIILTSPLLVRLRRRNK